MSRVTAETLAAFASYGIEPPPDVEAPFADAHAKLMLGAVLSGSRATARAGLLAQVYAALSAFGEMGHDPVVLAPLANLERMLTDLDRGIVDPLLVPSHRPESRAPDASRIWQARALLVAACDVRIALGEDLNGAAARVVADARLRLGVDVTAKTLLGWRKMLGRTGQSAAPRDGGHHMILARLREGIARAKERAPTERERLLAESYDAILNLVGNRLPDGPQAQNAGI